MKSTKTPNSSGLWGELPPRETFKQEIITPDIIENVWRQVMDASSNTDCDYQNQIDRQPEFIQIPMGNPNVLNTINLHHQFRMMKEGTVLKSITTIDNQNDEEPKEPSNPFHFLPSRVARNQENLCSDSIYLTPKTARNLLTHTVIILLAHIGFEKSIDVAIETLTDVAEHFLKRMTVLLKIAVEQKDYGFPDAMERVLLETGVGGVVALHNYYQEYILKFEENMKRKVEKLMEEQRQLELTVNSTNMDLDESANKLQFEELDEFGNVYREVPTLQLLDPDIGFSPSLDAGFQMLHSLEQDELNNLEVAEDEVNIKNSPNTSQRSNTDNKNK